LTCSRSFLASQKDGFDTWLDPTGKRLSRNVIQKILLVRALAGDPKLLLLEEPWLGIEQPYQDQIKKLLLKNFPGTTVLIVSNDSEFAARCDKIIDVSQDGLYKNF
jgi:ATP-binding cassette, subfamily B, bacterial